MRILPLLIPLTWLAGLVGCSAPDAAATNNTVDVAAAAARAQSDIANYAAGEGKADARPLPRATATARAIR